MKTATGKVRLYNANIERVCVLASFPGHSQILSCSCGEKSGEGPVTNTMSWNGNGGLGYYVMWTRFGKWWQHAHAICGQYSKWSNNKFCLGVLPTATYDGWEGPFHSDILPSCHSAVLPYCHSTVLPFYRPAFLPFCHSGVRIWIYIVVNSNCYATDL